jgi:transcriptional regulator with XRE-family HTH domain
MTNRELGDLIGVSASMASRIRNGKRLPSIEVMDRLALALGIDLIRLVNTYTQGANAFGALVRELLHERKLD